MWVKYLSCSLWIIWHSKFIVFLNTIPVIFLGVKCLNGWMTYPTSWIPHIQWSHTAISSTLKSLGSAFLSPIHNFRFSSFWSKFPVLSTCYFSFSFLSCSWISFSPPNLLISLGLKPSLAFILLSICPNIHKPLPQPPLWQYSRFSHPHGFFFPMCLFGASFTMLPTSQSSRAHLTSGEWYTK